MSIFSKALRIGEGKRLKELEALVVRVDRVELPAREVDELRDQPGINVLGCDDPRLDLGDQIGRVKRLRTAARVGGSAITGCCRPQNTGRRL